MSGCRLNGTEFSDWLVVPADDDHVTIFDLIEITREMGLGLLNVDFDHVLVYQRSDQNSGLKLSPNVAQSTALAHDPTGRQPGGDPCEFLPIALRRALRLAP